VDKGTGFSGGFMPKTLSRLSFYAAFALSAFLTVILLGAAANFGFGQVIAAGPTAVLVVAVMLLNPVVFGLVGFVKGEPRWHLIAAIGMLSLLVLYALLAFGHFGPVFG
jgi:hypothetical protein